MQNGNPAIDIELSKAKDGVTILHFEGRQYHDALMTTLLTDKGIAILFQRKTIPEPKIGLFHWAELETINGFIAQLEDVKARILAGGQSHE